jgi:ectoine hydroxylase-related dioxygenase (phytanoyl-CoA dioxygenase family)
MHLADDAIAAYERDGFYCPIPVLAPDELAGCAARLAPVVRAILDDPQETQRLQYKAHLLYPWLDRLVRHPAILDAVESLLGPDLLVWNSGFLVKAPHDSSFVSWHQDSTYWGLEPMTVASAWLAFSDSTPENGCVYCLPGSHRLEQMPHRDTYAKDNMLSRGQAVDWDFDEASAVPLRLRPGEMSLHHVRTIHGSRPNRSDTHRIGYIINYISPAVRQKSGSDSATLVRGLDRFGHFEREPRPTADRDAAALAAHTAAVERQMANILD